MTRTSLLLWTLSGCLAGTVIAGPAAQSTRPTTTTPTISPDSKRIAYTAKSRGKWHAFVDGAPGDPYDELGRPYFSVDSRRVAYRAKERGKWSVVVDGTRGEAWDEVEGTPFFSPDGGRVVYRAKRGKGWFVVVDGQPGPTCEDVRTPSFSPDGRHLAYVAKREGRWRLMVDGVEGDEYDYLARWLVFDEPQRLHTLIRRGDEFLRLEVELPAP